MDNELFERHVKKKIFHITYVGFSFFKRSLYPVNDYCGMKGKKRKGEEGYRSNYQTKHTYGK